MPASEAAWEQEKVKLMIQADALKAECSKLQVEISEAKKATSAAQ